MQAVILAGGKGTRLASRLNGRPKPLVPVLGRPLLDRQLEQLLNAGFDDVLVLVNHAADQIHEFLAGSPYSRSARLIDDGEPRGTAGALLACLGELRERVLVVYGDTLFDIDIAAMVARHEAKGADATLLLHPNDHPMDSDLVDVDEDDRVVAFHTYPHDPDQPRRNLVNAAFYVLETKPLAVWAGETPPLDLAKDLFPRMLGEGARLFGYSSFEYIKDLGTPKRLDKVEAHLASGRVERASRTAPQQAVFIDRDGTLNALAGYVNTRAKLRVLPGAAEAVAKLNAAEYRAIVVTNQPVLARGECDAAEMARIHAKLEWEFGRNGAYLDAIYHCPHHPDGGFAGEVTDLKIACDCRKPAPGLIDRACADFHIDRRRSWMIGDTSTDAMAAKRAGLPSVIVNTGEGGRDGKYLVEPDFSARDVLSAVGVVLDLYPLLARKLESLRSLLPPGALVVVGGQAKSGKSTLASVLAWEIRRSGGQAQIVRLDRWLRSEGSREPGVLGRFDGDAAQALLRPWFDGQAVRAQTPWYDAHTRSSCQGPELEVDPADVLIVEGVPALLMDWPTSRPRMGVFVDSDEPDRRLRVLNDMIDRGRGAAEAEAALGLRDLDEHDPVDRSRTRADHVISFTAKF